jgi:ElaB/YqjD/DUF883 family membrane-anchored ribosome-binding protein
MRSNETSHRPNKELIKEITALRSQLKRLSATMESESESGVSRALSAVESKSKEAIDATLSAAQNFIDQYADGVRDAARDISSRTGELRDSASESVVDMVRARPFTTVAAIAGIGFLAGCLFRRH